MAESIPAVGRGYFYSLDELIVIWRKMLDDENEPYLWDNDELTWYAHYLTNNLCAEMHLIEDRTTEEICQVTLAVGDGFIDIDPRITHIKRARITGQTTLLGVKPATWMDNYYTNWDSDTIDQSTPTKLVYGGVGNGRAYLYPPSDAIGTLEFVVYRRPLEVLNYALHRSNPLEIDRFAHYLHNGILSQAYLKQDTDTYDPARSEKHRVLWEGENGLGGDKEQIRREAMRMFQEPTSASPMAAFM